MRETLIVGNWKMNGSISLIKEMVETLRSEIDVNNLPCTVAFCPPALYVDSFLAAVKDTGIKVGTQNIYPKPSGAFTGEISAPMLKEWQVDFCIVGHSERRSYFGETDEMVNQKSAILLENGIRPIICVGETLDQRESGEHESVVIDQLNKALANLSSDQLKSCVIAYEPVWAIGTGKTATSEQANQMHKVIRKQLEAISGSETAEAFPILYGGSANAKNAAELLAQSDIDGLLVGGASLKPADFSTMIKAKS